MDEKEITEKIKDALVEVLGIKRNEISEDSSIIDDLGAESLDLLDLVFRLEQAFNIKLSRRDIESKAREVLSVEEFESDRVLSEQSIAKLKKQLPEINGKKIKADLRSSEIARLFTVMTFARIIKEKLEENKNDTGK